MDLDRFLNIFNWITSAEGVLGDVFSLVRQRGGGVGIAFAAPTGKTGGDIERALARYKIPVWGRRVTGLVDVGKSEKWDGYSLRTEANRADWARYIIWRAGGYVINDPNPDNATWAAKYTNLPPAWADGPGRAASRVEDADPPAAQGKPAPRQPGRARRVLRDLW